ncbi:MAG TPA: hypothetical protein PKA38_01765 [Candidatus Levybacteria bacterium]|nr:hypothetical protein [Candidatus Levybacteria bacterium]
MRTEVPQFEKLINANSPRREDFGPGKAGGAAYLLVLKKEPCGFIASDPVNKQGGSIACGKESIATLDFDFPITNDLEHIPVCSEEHFRLVQNSIKEEITNLGESGGRPWISFGINGWGRH